MAIQEQPHGVPDYLGNVELFQRMPRVVELDDVPTDGIVHIETYSDSGLPAGHLAFRRYPDSERGQPTWTLLHDAGDVVIEEPVMLEGACLTPFGNVSESINPGVRLGAYFGFTTYAPLSFRTGADVPGSEYVHYEPPEQLRPDIRDEYLACGMVEPGPDGLLYWRTRGYRDPQVTPERVGRAWVELPEPLAV